MTTDYPIDRVPATAKYVLSVLQDDHRQRSQWDIEADPTSELTFESTVADWRDACDLVNWRRLGRSLNEWWEISCSDKQWRELLEPPKMRTLRELCGFIAGHATAPVIRPARLMGSTCRTAGAFLSIRSYLAAAGVDADSIGPSTPLDAYTRRYPAVFMGPVARLAPGLLPTVTISAPVHEALRFMFVTGLLLALGGSCVGVPVVPAIGAMLAIPSLIGWYLVGNLMRPRRISFGELRTFRDLATLIAASTFPL